MSGTKVVTVTCPVCRTTEIDVYLKADEVWNVRERRYVTHGASIEDMDGPCSCRMSDCVDQDRYTEKLLEATAGRGGVDVRDVVGAA